MITSIKGIAKLTQNLMFRVLSVVMALIIFGAGTAFAASNAPYVVDIYDGATVTRIETNKQDARSIVADADIIISDNDLLILDRFEPDSQSSIIVCRYSTVNYIDEDGNKRAVQYAGRVGDFIESMGVSLGDHLVSSVNVRSIVSDGMTVQILNAYDLTVNVDNEKHIVRTTASTVGEVLDAENILLGADDEIDPSADTKLYNDMVINVYRVDYETFEEEKTVSYEKKTVYSSALNKGVTKVTQEGEDGTKLVTYRNKIVDGEVVSTTVESEKTIKAATPEITTIGTKVAASGNSKIKANSAPISELTPPAGLEIGKNSVPANYKYTIKGKATAYCVPGGKTATGKNVKPGYIAVNPKQIPYGTKLWIVSDSGIVYGYAIAADTGGFASKGTYVCDLYMDSLEQCYQWGCRNVTIYVLG
ncbi:MAG: G5 domain-containing protein [Clostridiales bacterium]|nr:G5 domain-containing protein [Clostridiales bacterium]